MLITSAGAPLPHRFAGAEHCIDMDGFFAMEELPETLVVLGGGGVEIAVILQALGVNVILVVKESKVIESIDADINELLV